MHKIRIGSRESRLAVIQSRLVIDYITENCTGYTPELVTMKTTGDMILDRSLDKVGGKGLFVKELDRCLLDGETDISVHSLKAVSYTHLDVYKRQVKHSPKVFAIVGGGDAVKKELMRLCEYGLGDVHVTAGKNLSYEDEKIYSGTAEELSKMELSGLFSMLVQNSAACGRTVTHGISDGEFVRGSAPMTKEEVRSVSLSKLRLKEDSVVYDVGAGTGSVSIEMALMAFKGAVYALSLIHICFMWCPLPTALKRRLICRAQRF